MRSVRMTVAAAGLVAVSFTASFSVGAAAILEHRPAAAVVTTAAYAAPAGNVYARAYKAFTTWTSHRTRRNLDVLVTDSYALPAQYDAADITQLAADVLGGAPRTDIARDVAYVGQDLTEAQLPEAS
jgi:hypothetical protein